MKSFSRVVGGSLLLAVLAGCESTSQKPATQPAAAMAPVIGVKPVVNTPAAAPAPVMTAAAREAAQRLMESQQPHEMLKVSAFAAYPQFTSANWSGLVLSSKVSTQSLAHTSNFKILRIEIHPLVDGRVRVWLEIGNFSNKSVIPEIACQFTPEDEGKNAKFTTMQEIGPGKETVTYFESHENAPFSYSILARNKRN